MSNGLIVKVQLTLTDTGGLVAKLETDERIVAKAALPELQSPIP